MSSRQRTTNLNKFRTRDRDLEVPVQRRKSVGGKDHQGTHYSKKAAKPRTLENKEDDLLCLKREKEHLGN